jgi:anthranilate phosphoribosyltransferase
MTIAEINAQLSRKADLTEAQVRVVMDEILSGRATEDEIKGFLIGLKEKGERAEEVLALVDSLYQRASQVEIPDRAVDIVGTGGDGFNTINISTSAAILITASGGRVVKHGNRAASSASGAADLLEALGININLDAKQLAECVRKIGIGFAFAPKFHPAMRYAAAARKSLGTPTIFNILGPLANPAKPKAVAIGVARLEMFELVAKVLAARGCEGFVFRGNEGLDEISIAGPSSVYQVREGGYQLFTFDPRNIGIELEPLSAIQGGDAKLNAEVTKAVFSGKLGAAREAILLNAAIGIAAFKGDFNLPLETQIANGYVLAKAGIDSGRALELIQRWRELSNELAKSSL